MARQSYEPSFPPFMGWSQVVTHPITSAKENPVTLLLRSFTGSVRPAFLFSFFLAFCLSFSLFVHRSCRRVFEYTRVKRVQIPTRAWTHAWGALCTLSLTSRQRIGFISRLLWLCREMGSESLSTGKKLLINPPFGYFYWLVVLYGKNLMRENFDLMLYFGSHALTLCWRFHVEEWFF